MKLAFCLYKYFPYGGLQRDFMRIAQECVQRGHVVHVYTMQWEGDCDAKLPVTIIPVSGLQNHTRCRRFVKNLQHHLKDKQYDLMVGFNKMPGLDIYYAADTCYQAKAKQQRHFFYRMLPRYRHLIHYEKSVFAAHTKILLIAENQQAEFQHFYHTPSENFYLLPPGISLDRKAPANAKEIRANMRTQFHVTEEDFLLLMVGSGFKTKGLDRTLNAIAALPQKIKQHAKLFVIGKDHEALFKQQAEQLGIADRVTFLGGRDDVPKWLLAADLLLHPAYNENTGTVLLEALVAGLPVITTDVCGYAHYINDAQAGVVISSPFEQEKFNQTLINALSSSRVEWQRNALKFAETADIYSLPQRAVDVIESMPARQSFNEMMQLKGKVYRELEGRRTQKITLHNKHYFIKQHFGVGWKEIIKNLLQLRLPIISAKSEWRALQKLHELNIPTMQVARYGARGFNPARKQSFLLTHELPSAISLEDLSRDWQNKPPGFKYKKDLIERVAHIAKTLHQNGMNHRDFYICHFLLATSGILYLIDLHRAQVRKKVPQRWLIKDLAGLYFSSRDIGLTQNDLLRFMRVYRAKPLRDFLSKEKFFWQKVKDRGDKLYQKHEKK